MIRLEVPTVARVLGARVVAGDGRVVDAVDAVMTDTRVRAQEPALFVALRTGHADGHDHVAMAADSGAVVALVERELSDVRLPQLVVPDTWVALGRLGRHVVDAVGCRVVAITGSYGKTTVKDLTAAALSAERTVTASHASFNNELGVPLTMLSVRDDSEILVVEAGARNAGDLALMASLLRPDISVVTAVGPVHLETFGDEYGVAKEKGRLVGALGPGGSAVLNGDDPRVAAMAAGAPAALLVRASGAGADIWVEEVTADEHGRARATVHTPWGSTPVALPIPGPHHLTNALLALGVAGLEGVDVEAAARSISEAATSPSRSAMHQVAGVTVLDDAYNASPPTVVAALTTLHALPCTGRRWAVLGVMAELGPSSEVRHREVGAVYAQEVDELVIVGESAIPLAEGAEQAGGSARVRRVADHVEAAQLLTEEVRPGDVVLLKASRVAGLDRAASALIEVLTGANAR